MYDAFVLNARNNGLIPRLALNRKKAPFKSSRRTAPSFIIKPKRTMV